MTKEEAREAIKEAYGNSEYTDEIIKALEHEPIEPVIASAYKTGYEMGRSITMIESVR
jgi:hypothetical protein